MNPADERTDETENLQQAQPSAGQHEQQQQKQKQAMTEVQNDAAEEREQEGGYQ